MTETATDDTGFRVYWQPGCSSCLKTKEFLTKNGIPFRSVDVLADADGLAELEALGIRHVPVVVRGNEWVSGQVLRDVAAFTGARWGHEMLPPETIKLRIDGILDGALRFAAQLPDDVFDTQLPDRPTRTYGGLACHIFQIIDAFIDENDGIPLTHAAYLAPPPDGVTTSADIVALGERARDRFHIWWNDGNGHDFTRRADVYYGEVNQHEFLERTAWHSGQHTRQLMLVLDKLGIAPAQPMTDTDFAGLPMPETVWDDEKRWD